MEKDREIWYDKSSKGGRGKGSMTQQEELVALRALVEEQKKELGKKDQLIKEKDDRIEQQDKRIRQLDIQVRSGTT